MPFAQGSHDVALRRCPAADQAEQNRSDTLRHAHERNDEVLERIYIGRRFKNDTERLEKLFDQYTKMTAAEKGKTKPAAKRRG